MVFTVANAVSDAEKNAEPAKSATNPTYTCHPMSSKIVPAPLFKIFIEMPMNRCHYNKNHLATQGFCLTIHKFLTFPQIPIFVFSCIAIIKISLIFHRWDSKKEKTA